jgi:glycosyltransferase involved in cell wall biosynthesis
MRVSVIIPTCQPGPYLFNCLDSIVNQDFDPDGYEIVIALNGPEKPYYDRIQEYFNDKKLNSRILHTTVKSVSAARNLALDSVSSDYIMFIDDDDLVTENFISALFSAVSDSTVAVGNWKTFLDDPADCQDNYVTRAYRKCEQNKNFSLYNYRTFLSSCCGKLIPRKIIGNHRFNEKLTVHEDALFMFKISRNISLIKLAGSEAIYFNRLRQDSASRIKKPLKTKITNFLKASWAYSCIFFSNPLKYNFLLYFSRIAGTVKFYLYKALERT